MSWQRAGQTAEGEVAIAGVQTDGDPADSTGGDAVLVAVEENAAAASGSGPAEPPPAPPPSPSEPPQRINHTILLEVSSLDGLGQLTKERLLFQLILKQYNEWSTWRDWADGRAGPTSCHRFRSLGIGLEEATRRCDGGVARTLHRAIGGLLKEGEVNAARAGELFHLGAEQELAERKRALTLETVSRLNGDGKLSWFAEVELMRRAFSMQLTEDEFREATQADPRIQPPEGVKTFTVDGQVLKDPRQIKNLVTSLGPSAALAFVDTIGANETFDFWFRQFRDVPFGGVSDLARELDEIAQSGLSPRARGWLMLWSLRGERDPTLTSSAVRTAAELVAASPTPYLLNAAEDGKLDAWLWHLSEDFHRVARELHEARRRGVRAESLIRLAQWRLGRPDMAFEALHVAEPTLQALEVGAMVSLDSFLALGRSVRVGDLLHYLAPHPWATERGLTQQDYEHVLRQLQDDLHAANKVVWTLGSVHLHLWDSERHLGLENERELRQLCSEDPRPVEANLRLVISWCLRAPWSDGRHGPLSELLESDGPSLDGLAASLGWSSELSPIIQSGPGRGVIQSPEPRAEWREATSSKVTRWWYRLLWPGGVAAVVALVTGLVGADALTASPLIWRAANWLADVIGVVSTHSMLVLGVFFGVLVVGVPLAIGFAQLREGRLGTAIVAGCASALWVYGIMV